ncbi:hypothetical protein GCM10027578_39110 [Spirosoma luteolum]
MLRSLIRVLHRYVPVTRSYRVTRWLVRRLSTDRFDGLPLTVLLAVLVVSLMTLSEIAERIVSTSPMVQIDMAFSRLLFNTRSARVSQFLYGLTYLGSAYATVFFLLLGSVVLWFQRKRRHILVLWLLVVGMAITVQAGKRYFVRPRPAQVGYYTEVGYSFPSGHSATAMTLHGLVGYWIVRGRRRIRHRLLVGIGTIILIGLVGFSRIYLGVHYLSDVLGGYLLGLSWLVVGIVLLEWQPRNGHPTELPPAA